MENTNAIIVATKSLIIAESTAIGGKWEQETQGRYRILNRVSLNFTHAKKLCDYTLFNEWHLQFIEG
jgi:hypothetical protein